MNLVSWFEIPVFDLHRAVAFYNAVLGLELTASTDGAYGMAVFPGDRGAGGALIAGPGCVPSEAGVLAYFDAGKDLDGALARVDQAGGRVTVGRSFISETAGSFGLFIDSEGNRVALLERPARVEPEPAALPAEEPQAGAPPAIAETAEPAATPAATPAKVPGAPKSAPGKRKRR